MLSTSFDAGVPLRDVQEAASHADPRTSFDRHATYIVATYLTRAARVIRGGDRHGLTARSAVRPWRRVRPAVRAECHTGTVISPSVTG